jgi:hypothetical protein
LLLTRLACDHLARFRKCGRILTPLPRFARDVRLAQCSDPASPEQFCIELDAGTRVCFFRLMGHTVWCKRIETMTHIIALTAAFALGMSAIGVVPTVAVAVAVAFAFGVMRRFYTFWQSSGR